MGVNVNVVRSDCFQEPPVNRLIVNQRCDSCLLKEASVESVTKNHINDQLFGQNDG